MRKRALCKMQNYENMNSVLRPAKMDKKNPLDFKGSVALCFCCLDNKVDHYK